MKISIASYAFHGLVAEGKMDVFGYLESCRYRYGLDAADIWNGMLASTGTDYLRGVKDALDEREMVLANLCVDQAHIWENDAEARERNYQNAWAHLRAADMLQARTIRIDAGGQDPDFSSEQFDLVVKRYREYARFAHDHGFRVGPENHWGPERNPGTLQRIIEAVDSPAFGLLLHVGSWQDADPDACDARFATHVMHTHFAWVIVESQLEAKMLMLKQAGYRGYWGVEYHAATSEYSQVGVQVARVRDVLARWRQ